MEAEALSSFGEFVATGVLETVLTSRSSAFFILRAICVMQHIADTIHGRGGATGHDPCAVHFLYDVMIDPKSCGSIQPKALHLSCSLKKRRNATSKVRGTKRSLPECGKQRLP